VVAADSECGKPYLFSENVHRRLYNWPWAGLPVEPTVGGWAQKGGQDRHLKPHEAGRGERELNLRRKAKHSPLSEKLGSEQIPTVNMT
jgi:hypothetical protein